MKSAVAGVQARAEDRGIRVEASIAGGLPPVLVDPDRVGQVLRNLVANALRYTPRGGAVQVSARPDVEAGSSANAGGFARVSVADTGSGIPPEDLPHVFDRFYRVDKSRARASGGTGLGLAVVKQLVESHGGRVWAESQLGRGTVFHFTLPTVSPASRKQRIREA